MRQRFLSVLPFLIAGWVPLAQAAVVPQTPFVMPAVPQLTAKAYVLMALRSGQVLAEQNPDQPIAAGGVVKLMTAYVVFQELRSGQIKLSTRFPVTVAAWRQPGTRMFLKQGAEVSVNDLLQGLIVDGGNDAAVALAQGIAGTRAAFVSLMNADAQALGMTHTRFVNVTGLNAPGQAVTALDLARLTRAVWTQFPQYLHYFSQKSFTWNGITQYNYNKLLWRDPQAVGFETGYGGKHSGWALAAGAQQGHQRMLATLLDVPSQPGSKLFGNLDVLTREGETLLNYGFRFYETRRLYTPGERITEVQVAGGAQPTVTVGIAKALYVSFPRGASSRLATQLHPIKPLAAPISKGERVGRIIISLNGKTLASDPAVALQTDPQGSLFQRLRNNVVQWYHQWLGKRG